MKQIEKVSIGGYVFTLETEAAAETDRYLNEMSAYYSNPEITDGIEERMAELLRERTPEDGVVTKATILSIIDILGRPERIAEEEPEEAGPDKPNKKLYRDIDNARLAGVCSGLSTYFKIDPVILRVAFVVLTLVGLFGFRDHHFELSLAGPVIYAILWICIPAAKTVRQKWELRGDDGTAESVRRSVERGANEFSNAVRQVGNAPAWGTIGRILEVAIGIFMLIIAFSGLFAGGLVIFGWDWLNFANVLGEVNIEITNEFPEAATIMAMPWVKALLAGVYFIPFIGMLYTSIMLIFKIKSPSWRPGLVLFIIWLLTIIALGILVSASYVSTITI